MSDSDLEEQNECDSSPIRNSLHHQQIEARFVFPQPWKCNHVSKNPERKLDCFDRSKVLPCNYATSKKLNKAAQKICKTCINECSCADYDPNAKEDLVEEKSPEEEEEDEESEEEEEEEAEEEIVESKDVAKIKSVKPKVDEKAPKVVKSDGDDGTDEKKKDDEKKVSDDRKEEKKEDDDGKKKAVDDGKKKGIQDKKKKGGEDGKKKGNDDGKKKGDDDGRKKGDGEMADDKICKTPCVLDGAVKRKPKVPCSKVMTKPCLGTCSKIPDSECVSTVKKSRIPVKLNCSPDCKTEREGQTKKPQCAAKAKSVKCSSCAASQSSQPPNKKTANDCKNCKSTKYVVQRALLEIPLSYYWLKSNKLRTIDLAKYNIAPDLLGKFGLQLIKFRSKDLTRSFKNEFDNTFDNSDNKSGPSEMYSSSVLPISLITQEHMRCSRNLHGMESPILMNTKEEKCTHGTKPKITCEVKEESDDIRINLLNPYTWLTGDEFCNPDNTSNLKTCGETSSHDSENSEYEISNTDSYCPSSEVTWSMMMGRSNETQNVSKTELSSTCSTSHQVMGEEKLEIGIIDGLRSNPVGSEDVAEEMEIKKV